MNNSKKIYLLLVCLCLSSDLWSAIGIRLKEVGRFDGIRENEVIGYGLVVGLSGTGDSKASMLSQESVRNLLSNLGQSC